MLRFAALIGLIIAPVVASAEQCQDEELAYKAATDYVMFHLKSPFSAIFPKLGEEHTRVKTAGTCVYSVSAYADALNSHGRMVRQGFSLQIAYDAENEEWIASELKTTGSSPSPSAPQQ